MRSCLLVLLAGVLAASDVAPLYQALFPADGAARAPYDLARFRVHLEAEGAEGLDAAARAEQAAWEAAWEQVERTPATQRDPRVALLDYAFGARALDVTLAAAADWPARQRLDLARLLVTEMRLDAAAGLVARLTQADPREPEALAAAFLCDRVLRRHARLAAHRPCLPLDPRWASAWQGLQADPHWSAAVRAIGHGEILPLADLAMDDGSVLEVERVRIEWSEGRQLRVVEGAVEVEGEGFVAGISLRRALATHCDDFSLLRRDRDWPRDGSVVLDLSTAFHGAIDLSLYRFDSETQWRQCQAADLQAHEVLRRWQHPGLPLRRNNLRGRVKHAIALHQLEPAFYLVQAQARYAPVVACARVAVSAEVLSASADHRELVVSRISRTNAAPIAGGLQVFLGEEALLVSTDADGHARLPLPPHAQALPLRLQAVDAPACSLELTAPAPPQPAAAETRLVAWCAQQLLRPGETAHLAAILREVLPTTARDAIGEDLVELAIQDPDGRNVFRSAVAGGHQGLLSWSWSVPVDADHGRYSITVNGIPAPAAAITVADYQPEAFEIAHAHFDQSTFAHGRPLSGGFQLRYLSGEGVAAAAVDLSWHCGEERQQETLHTDATGRLTWRLTPPADWLGRVRLVLTCAPVGVPPRSTTVSTTISAEPFQVEVSGHGNPRIDETYQLRIRVRDWNGDLRTDASVQIDSDPTRHTCSEAIPITLSELGPRTLALVVRSGTEEHRIEHRLHVRPERRQRLAAEAADPAQQAPHEEPPDFDEYRPVAPRIAVHWPDGTGYRQLPAGDAVELQLDIVASADTPAPEAGYLVQISAAADTLLHYEEQRLDPGQHAITLQSDAAWIPGAVVGIRVLDGHHQVERTLRVPVVERRRLLRVAVEPERSRYRPGDLVRARIVVRDGEGQAVGDAAITLAVVDRGVDEILPYRPLPIRERLTTWTIGSAVASVYDRPYPQLPGLRWWLGGKPSWVADLGEYHSVGRYGSARRSAAAVSRAEPRRDFRSLASWQADLRSDPAGVCTVSWRLPDGLTAWRITAVAVTADAGGTQSATITASQGVRLRPHVPPALRQGDRVGMPIAVHLDGKPTTAIQLQAELTLEDGKRSLAKHSGQITRMDQPWQLPEFTVPAGEAVVLQLEADAGALGGDGSEHRIPILPPGSPQRWVQNGSLERRSVSLDLRGAVGDPSAQHAELQLRVSFGLNDDLDAACAELRQYPYGCVEQTLSRFYPAVVATAARGEAPDADLRSMIAAGVARLRELRRKDGSWGWFQEGGDPFITAYAIQALCRAQHLGETGFDLQPSVDWLQRQAAGSRRAHRHIGAVDAGLWHDAAMVAAQRAGLAVADEHMLAIAARCQLVTVHHEASLRDRALALHLAVQLDPGSPARTVLRGLLGSCAAAAGREQILAAGDLLAAAALLAGDLTPADQRRCTRVREIVLAARSGAAWVDTFVTAAAITGLAPWQAQAESQADAQVEVVLDREVVALLSVDGDHALRLALDPRQHRRLELRRNGSGHLRYQAALSWYGAVPVAAHADVALRLQRAGVTVGDTLRVQRGQAVELDLELALARDLPFALLRIPRPSGLRITAIHWGAGLEPSWQDHRLGSTDACFELIPAGRHRIRLTTVATLSGDLAAPAPLLQSMYGASEAVAIAWPERWLVD